MMTKKHNIYPVVESNADFPKLEEKIIAFWKKHNIFQKSVDNPPGSGKSDDPLGKPEEFIFYDGPPFANGLPHYGHLLTGFIKDLYARYQTTKGKKVERRFGWDCHGLPAEMGAEKELGISGRIAITEYGIGKFNDTCRSSVMKYSGEWEKYVTRQARFVDFENSYKTMDLNFMESTLWAFKSLYDKGYIYESMRVMPYSWACETPLSNFETRLDNSYRERADKSVTVSFKLNQRPNFVPQGYEEYRILAWTTTPWTLPSNLALAVHPEMEYVAVPQGKICYILASFALKSHQKELSLDNEATYNKGSGRELVGITYEPLFDYFKNHPNSFRILPGTFVLEGDGTGVVHMAPGFGEDDQLLCAEHNIEVVCPVDNAGKFTTEVPDFQGLQVFDANDPIIIKLKNQGSWIKTEQYLHNYPHCWRTDTPLIYKAVPSFYVKVTEFKDRMVELNQQINWTPSHIKDGMFGKWLENARDWSISRNRFWGTPIPIWKSDNPLHPRVDVYGSIAEIEKDFGVKVTDLHRPFIDELTRPNPDDPTGKSMMRRVPDVFDCWFESGSMPYGQVHYPFENKDWFEKHFPADFIVEYTAQTRGWFYTLMVLSTALFDRPPFLNCVCHGVILDSTGQKLSKRLNNYADPIELFSKYGADALRFTMLSSTVVKGQELLIDKEGKMVFDTLRLHIKPIWNAYHFFTLYANADGIEAKISYDSTNKLDQYVLSKLGIAISKIEQGLDNFDSQIAYSAVSGFFEVLNNWYIRRSRQRFWKTEKDGDKLAAYNTLYTSLEHMCRAMSSMLPLISEEIYRGLYKKSLEEEGDAISVHLAPFPDVSRIKVDSELTQTMDKILEICNAGLFIRNTENLRVRQPLQSAMLVMRGTSGIKAFEDLIKDELNIKSVIYQEDLESHADFKLSINFPILGKRLPHKIKDIISASKKGEWSVLGDSLSIMGEILSAEEFTLKLEAKNPKGAASLASNDGIVILDMSITRELELEGVARDIIRAVQQTRKEADFDISDHIILECQGGGEIAEAVALYGQLIEEQTLSQFGVVTGGFSASVEVGDSEVILKMSLK
ncbi:MAG: isoleucine--tRNA ligase [Pseudomonadota bacterium]